MPLCKIKRERVWGDEGGSCRPPHHCEDPPPTSTPISSSLTPPRPPLGPPAAERVSLYDSAKHHQGWYRPKHNPMAVSCPNTSCSYSLPAPQVVADALLHNVQEHLLRRAKVARASLMLWSTGLLKPDIHRVDP